MILFNMRPVSATNGSLPLRPAFATLVHLRRVKRIGCRRANGDASFPGRLFNCVLSRSALNRSPPAAAARHFVFVGRTDSFACGPDLLPPRRVLGGQFKSCGDRAECTFARWRTNNCSSTATPKSRSRAYFLKERQRIQHTPLPMMPLQPGRRYAAWNQLQDESLAADDDRVSRVMASRVACHGTEPLAEHVHNLALALSPIGRPALTAVLARMSFHFAKWPAQSAEKGRQRTGVGCGMRAIRLPQPLR